MTTVASVLNGLRYDLRNYGDVDFDIDQMIHYLNRAIQLLDAKLISWNSDQTITEALAALSKGYDYVSVPTRCLAIREVWIDQDRKQPIDIDDLYYRRQYKKNVLSSGDSIAVGNLCKTITRVTTDLTGLGAADNNADTYWVCSTAGSLSTGDSVWRFDGQEPSYYAHVGEQIQFDAASSAAETVRVIYDAGSADVTSSGTMPYSGTYDDVLREVVVQMILHKKKKLDSPTDAVYARVFDQILTMDIVNRRFSRKHYRLDF